MLLSHKHRTYSLRHPLALELHNKLAPRPQLLGEAQEARAGRSRKAAEFRWSPTRWSRNIVGDCCNGHGTILGNNKARGG